VYGGGRVSNFRPTAAKALVAKYSSEGDAVLDFSAGYGGRLLGCLTLDRQYIGIDPAVEQIRGLYRMAHSLRALSRTRISLVQACAEDFMPRLDPRCIDLVFSSPPYFNVEKYSTADNQSFRRYGTYDLWKERFLHAVIQSTYRVLRKGGFLVLNIANTPRHAIARDIARSIEKFFCLRETMQLVMHVRPLQRSRGLAPYRWEPVFIFEKIA
jgi:DNA modification methylase